MEFSPLTQALIDALKCLPGVGTKTSQRMAINLLQKQREQGVKLAHALKEALTHVKHCASCRNFSEVTVCALCTTLVRSNAELCIVETPIDLIAIEQMAAFKGRYFVLQGHLSPLDGIGPKELRLDELDLKLQSPEIKEVILAINPTIEGQATCHYLTEMSRRHSKTISQIAYGVPFGGELEWVDTMTLNHAFQTRKYID